MSLQTSNPSREAALKELKDNPRTQVLIIGGGINGVGVFRDLALQGVDCLLVDKSDWCAGTSAAPSRLIHGGLKYLETGEFRLVAESTRERNLLLKNAPHYVHTLASVVPIRSYFGGVLPAIRRFLGGDADLADRGLLIVELGMILYDLLGARRRMTPLHRIKTGRSVRRAFPLMDSSVIAIATYYDACVSQAERLGFELINDGVQAHSGARAINYFAADGFEGGSVRLVDQRSLGRYQIRPDVIINAAGPWIDQVNHALTLPTDYIGGAKGSHLVIDSPELVGQLRGQMIYYGGADGRVCLVYPFFGHALLGSTDIPFDDPDAVVCSEDETSYMLSTLREVFPDIAIKSDQVIYRYSGVRPLPLSATPAGGQVTRDHSLRRDNLSRIPTYSMIGGKWTTFRAFSEETADVVLETIGRKRVRSTAREPVGGGRGFPISDAERAVWIARFSETHEVDIEQATLWLERYGSAADRIAAAAGGRPGHALTSLPNFRDSEIVALAKQEQVVSLADLIFRRTPIAIAGQLSVPAVEELGRIVGGALGWASDQIDREIEVTIATARDKFGVRLPSRSAPFEPDRQSTEAHRARISR
jgi:glycerol-3-phosphate dehydrogenase